MLKGTPEYLRAHQQWISDLADTDHARQAMQQARRSRRQVVRRWAAVVLRLVPLLRPRRSARAGTRARTVVIPRART